MAFAPRTYALADLTWTEVQAHLARDSRLIVPVGVCDQFGPHLPIGSATLVTEAFARDLSEDFGVLRAPTVPYGVSLPAQRDFPGAATLREKTLHRLLNDLLGAWEDGGFTEFILITAHVFDPHAEALATVQGTQARIRVIEALNLDFGDILEGCSPPEHAGEVMTALMLHLYPDRVRRDQIEDFCPPGLSRARTLQKLPLPSPGVVGQPSAATAERGKALYEHILQKIRLKVFVAPPDIEAK